MKEYKQLSQKERIFLETGEGIEGLIAEENDSDFDRLRHILTTQRSPMRFELLLHLSIANNKSSELHFFFYELLNQALKQFHPRLNVYKQQSSSLVYSNERLFKILFDYYMYLFSGKSSFGNSQLKKEELRLSHLFKIFNIMLCISNEFLNLNRFFELLFAGDKAVELIDANERNIVIKLNTYDKKLFTHQHLMHLISIVARNNNLFQQISKKIKSYQKEAAVFGQLTYSMRQIQHSNQRIETKTISQVKSSNNIQQNQQKIIFFPSLIQNNKQSNIQLNNAIQIELKKYYFKIQVKNKFLFKKIIEIAINKKRSDVIRSLISFFKCKNNEQIIGLLLQHILTNSSDFKPVIHYIYTSIKEHTSIQLIYQLIKHLPQCGFHVQLQLINLLSKVMWLYKQSLSILNLSIHSSISFQHIRNTRCILLKCRLLPCSDNQFPISELIKVKTNRNTECVLRLQQMRTNGRNESCIVFGRDGVTLESERRSYDSQWLMIGVGVQNDILHIAVDGAHYSSAHSSELSITQILIGPYIGQCHSITFLAEYLPFQQLYKKYIEAEESISTLVQSNKFKYSYLVNDKGMEEVEKSFKFWLKNSKMQKENIYKHKQFGIASIIQQIGGLHFLLYIALQMRNPILFLRWIKQLLSSQNSSLLLIKNNQIFDYLQQYCSLLAKIPSNPRKTQLSFCREQSKIDKQNKLQSIQAFFQLLKVGQGTEQKHKINVFFLLHILGNNAIWTSSSPQTIHQVFHKLRLFLADNTNQESAIKENLHMHLLQYFLVDRPESVIYQKVLRACRELRSSNSVYFERDICSTVAVMNRIKGLHQNSNSFLLLSSFFLQCLQQKGIQGINTELIAFALHLNQKYFQKRDWSSCARQCEEIIDNYIQQTIIRSNRSKLALRRITQKIRGVRMSKNTLYQLDQKEVGPYNMYKLNIKLVQEEYPLPRRSITADISEDENSLCREQNQSLFSQNTSQMVMTQMKGKKHKSQYYCEYVTKRGVYAGLLSISSKHLFYRFISHNGLPKGIIYEGCTNQCHKVKQLSIRDKYLQEFSLQLKHCRVFSRRYLSRQTALQIFINHQSYFLNVFTHDKKQQILDWVRGRVSECVTDPTQSVQEHTRAWTIGRINNFQYLMLLNMYAGRSLNDLSQYYVFPWIYNDYAVRPPPSYPCSTFETILNPQLGISLRDLSLPAGLLNPDKAKRLKKKHLEAKEISPQMNFLFGSMYSNPTMVSNYMIRLKPFTSLHYVHQGHRIDHADRLFASVQDQFSTVLKVDSDMRQLIPQFYYLRQFLSNRNALDLGMRQNKQEVHHVILPYWAHSPDQFIFKMRHGLDSSCTLHTWIDLIFGYKADIRTAQLHDNLFQPRTYPHDIFATLTLHQTQTSQQMQMQLTSSQVQISEFGQVPPPLFHQPHPARVNRGPMLLDSAHLIHTFKEDTTPNYLPTPQGVVVWSGGTVTLKRTLIQGILFQFQSTQHYKVQPFEQVCIIDAATMHFVTLTQGILRSYWGRTLKGSIDVGITTMQNEKKRVFGVSDCTIVVVKVTNKGEMQMKEILYGHREQIVSVKINVVLDILISVDCKLNVIIRDLTELTIMRGFQMDACIDLNADRGIHKRNIVVQVHAMGYIVAVSLGRRLHVYRYPMADGSLIGDQIVNQQVLKETVSDVQVMNHNEPILVPMYGMQLLSTTAGNIYAVDFIQVAKFHAVYPYKKYNRVPKSLTHKFQPKINALLRITLTMSFMHHCPIYQIIALTDNGLLYCFSQTKILSRQLQSDPKLKSLRIF